VRRTILLLTLIFCLVAPGAARASDGAVRSAVRSAVASLRPAASDWSRAVVRYTQTRKAAPLRRATQRLGRAVGRARARVARQRGSTAKGRKGRTLYLRAMTRLRAGLRAYDRALAGGGRRALDEAQRQISAADRDGTRAARLLGVTG
jgi:hypothetical protein